MSATAICGSCTCERVRFELKQPVNWVAHCHCSNCRRAHGAGSVTYAGAPRESLRFTAGEELLTRFEADTGSWRRFCSHCGSTLTFEGARWPGEVHVIVANLLEPLDKLPEGHAYSDRAPDWFPITDNLPCYGGDSGTEAI
ncbi:MAG: hypothetical protein ACI9F9_001086 [Candidatus Paceibacteria bacterium]|jgi:hypothetical protein